MSIKVKDIWKIEKYTIILLETSPLNIKSSKVRIDEDEFSYEIPYDLPNSIAILNCSKDNFNEVIFA